MNVNKIGLSGLSLSAVASLLSATAAWSQTPAAADTSPAASEVTALQEVVVSTSRIDIAGYDAPTPVTSVGLQDLQAQAKTDISNVLDSLPQFGQGTGPRIANDQITNGTEGLDVVNLRNLGIIRTLVLFDGQRVVPSNITGGVDLSTVPQNLIERVDVVTGGASAAWGSDAVAGVVNLVINHKFDGVQINLEDSNNWQSELPTRKVDITAGTGFADNRGHIEFGATYMDQPTGFFSNETEGFDYQRLMPIPRVHRLPDPDLR